VVFDKWSGFVITERARGRSIGVAAGAITFRVGRCFAVNDSFSRLPRQPLFVKMDVWELVRPSKNIEWPFLSSKAQSGGSGGLALRQAALLTYELLGDEKKNESEVQRLFKPVNELGDADQRAGNRRSSVAESRDPLSSGLSLLVEVERAPYL
jgi:hypothetical protein